MIPARNEINAHAQDFTAIDELFLPALSAFDHCILLEMLHVLSLYVPVEEKLSFLPATVLQYQFLRTAPHTLLPSRGIHLMICGL